MFGRSMVWAIDVGVSLLATLGATNAPAARRAKPNAARDVLFLFIFNLLWS
jgi:hypothetical protein